MSCSMSFMASVGSGSRSSPRPPLRSISCRSWSLLSMILLSNRRPGPSLGQVSERLTRLRISELRRGGEGICPEGRSTHGICEIDEHREAPVLLHYAVGHGKERSLMCVIRMSLEELEPSRMRESENTQSPRLRFRALVTEGGHRKVQLHRA